VFLPRLGSARARRRAPLLDAFREYREPFHAGGARRRHRAERHTRERASADTHRTQNAHAAGWRTFRALARRAATRDARRGSCPAAVAGSGGRALASNPAGNERSREGERRRASPEWRRGRARASEGRAWFVMLRASRHTSGQDARKGGLWRMLRGGIQDATRRDAGTLHGAGGGVRRAVGEQVA